MRIAYLSFEPPSPNTGVGQKIRAQMNSWRHEGHQVLHVVLRAPADIVMQDNTAYPVRRKFLKPMLSASIYRKAIRAALEDFTPDILYSRQMLWWPGLNYVSNGMKVIEEVNSDITTETHGTIKRGLLLVPQYISTKPAGRIFVTHELQRKFTDPRVPDCVISNGVFFPEVQRPQRRPRSGSPQLIMALNRVQPWHGLDLLFRLAKRLPHLTFHVAGPVTNKGVPHNVRLHGHLDRQSLDALYEQMDIGIGSLALHRNQMDEACPLKVREYILKGLPVIAAYKDTDLEEAPYFLNLGDVETVLAGDLGVIHSFIEKWKGRSLPMDDAIRLLSHKTKESKRLAFMSSLV